MVLHFCTFLHNPHFDLELDYIVRKPMKHRFQRYIVRTEIFSTFHTQVEYISQRTICDSAYSNECAHTDRQTHKSENSISARLQQSAKTYPLHHGHTQAVCFINCHIAVQLKKQITNHSRQWFIELDCCCRMKNDRHFR